MKAQQAQTMQTTEGDTSLLEEILADAHAAGKDTSVLTRDERSALLVGLARKLGLNPLSGAVMFLRTNGRETLYVTKQGTDQIAARERLCRETIKGPEVVTIEGKKVVLCQVRAKHPDGREEVSTATLALADPVNDLMKCETKAKRRATLSVCGLGLLAEDEIETIPGAQPVSLTIPTTTAPKGHSALEGFAADLDAAETVRDLRICYESLIAAMRAEGVSVEEMQPTLNDAAHQIHGALEERLGLHLAGAEMTALLGASGDVFARALDVLRVSVSRGVDAVAQWWVNSRRDLGETLGGQCYRVAQRSLADEPRDAASVKRAGASLKAAVARLDAPPPDGTSGPAKGTGNGATASASSAATEATAAPSALAAVPTWAADAASIRAHVASYTHPAAVVAGARKWGALLGDRYLRACADRLATLDPTCADHALGMVQTYAVEGPKRKAA